jgi:hypothetical protein
MAVGLDKALGTADNPYNQPLRSIECHCWVAALETGCTQESWQCSFRQQGNTELYFLELGKDIAAAQTHIVLDLHSKVISYTLVYRRELGIAAAQLGSGLDPYNMVVVCLMDMAHQLSRHIASRFAPGKLQQ